MGEEVVALEHFINNKVLEKNGYKENFSDLPTVTILIKNNRVTEATHSNVWIIKNNTIYTHPSNSDILKGITRKVIKKIIKILIFTRLGICTHKECLKKKEKIITF